LLVCDFNNHPFCLCKFVAFYCLRNLKTSPELNRLGYLEDSMAKALKTGDKVAWRSSGGGSVEKELTSPSKIKGHEVAASHDNPEFMVRSEKLGKIVAHKSSALRRVK
jgi:hypothetical protein